MVSAYRAWRPMRHGLSGDVLDMLARQRATGRVPLPVHLVLVTDGPPERARVACDGGLGEWITGDTSEVTCDPCRVEARAIGVAAPTLHTLD